MSLCYGGVSITGVLGNLLVLWVVKVSRKMQTNTNILIANLAMSDAVIGAFAVPFQFQAALLQRWNLPKLMCGLCPFVQVCTVNVSVFTLTTIAMDRYRAILYPFKALQTTKRELTITVSSIWCLSIILALPQEFDYNVEQVDDGHGSMKDVCALNYFSPAFWIYYNLTLVVLQYVVPLVIISVAYVIMAKQIWGHRLPGNKEAKRDINDLRNKKKVVKMLLVVVVVFGTCWLPLQTYNFLQWITNINEYQYINIIWFCCHWLAMSNCCCNPIIYGICSENFQKEFRQRIPFFRTWTNDIEDVPADEDAAVLELCQINQVRNATPRIHRTRVALREHHVSRRIDVRMDSNKVCKNAPLLKPVPISPACNRYTIRALVHHSDTNSIESTV